ncbi:MFS transporter [Pseudonocardia halophobica]|uniref:MFS transporter n=1 Tax=Pseudonocardia halophobica TaxID=29401 RepID=A0A9W6KZZ4_9PSEU|nr:MFS transporter [Pseudonocardia halophobica]GLL11086.1 MFS transporter [Pseudonocardia halophobica]
MAEVETRRTPWYAGLNRNHRRVLYATFAGWAFDGYETQALVVVVAPALAQLLPADQRGSIGFYSGLAIGLTLLGWGIGGLVGGVLADYVGRRRVMLFAIVGYALFTGLTALSTSFEMLIAFRILTGIAMGSEWATGTVLLQETWPDRARAKGAGFMQSGFGFGTLLAALIWFLIQGSSPGAWRWMFVIGIAPAFLVLYIRRRLEESRRWQDAVAAEKQAHEKRTFTLHRLFADPVSRRRVLVLLVLSLGTIIGWYAVSAFLPQFAVPLARASGVAHPESWGALAVVFYNVGAILGYIASGFVADALGRRWLVAIIFGGSLVMTPITYLWWGGPVAFQVVALVNGAFTLGGFAWFAIYLPELFGSTVRSTATGFVFNATRLIAWIGPIVSGSLIATFGGVSRAALYMGTAYLLGLVMLPFLHETKDEPLPP